MIWTASTPDSFTQNIIKTLTLVISNATVDILMEPSTALRIQIVSHSAMSSNFDTADQRSNIVKDLREIHYLEPIIFELLACLIDFRIRLTLKMYKT